ncbi:MAG: DUF4214 domain-containing protein [Bryobacteraceae bacterium]|nr:DUF4214 domain-containing protein [Bryobacteraceae bacterium]
MKLLIVLLLVVSTLFPQETRLGPAPYLPEADSKKADGARSAAAPAAIPNTWYNISTRSISQLAYLNDYAPATGIALGFTGNVATGVAGDTSAAYKQAVINRVNYYRAMAGVPANITLGSTLNSKSQYGALMMAANQLISHTPPTSWMFYTADGAATLGKSNVCQGMLTDPGCVEEYMADQGSTNGVVGHRRWILYTRQLQMGTGDVPHAIPGFVPNLWNALYVLDTFLPAEPAIRDGFIAWPPKGYVPYQLNFPRWSLSVSGADLSAVVLKVRKNAGAFTTQTYETPVVGYGNNTVIFNPEGRDVNGWNTYTPAAPASDTTYTVSVENVKLGNVVQPAYVYDVIVFDPSTTPASTCTPSITNYNATSGYQNVTINISGGTCGAWTAAGGASWSGIYPSTGTGTGSTTLTIYPNFTSATRTTSAVVGGVPITITQPSVGGTADQRFVGQLYYYMLGRIAGTSEIASQVALLPTLGRAGIANSFLNSAEFSLKSRYIAGLYVGLLNRDSEFGGWQFQRNALLNGIATATSLVTNFINSPEYLLQHPGQTNDQFVRMLYAQVLLRTPSQSEVDFQVAALAGWNRTAMASAFLSGPEFQTGTGPRLLSFLFYATLLNRDPTAAEMTAMVTSLTAASEAQRVALLNSILTSPEYLALLQ